MKTLRSVVFIILISIITISLSACKNGQSGPAGPDTQTGNFSLSIKSSNTLAKTSADSLRIDTVTIVIRDIKLENETGGDSNESRHSDSTEVETGPFVISLDTKGTVNTIAVSSIPAGTYNQLVFSIHKPEDNENPPGPVPDGSESKRYSVVVKGTYNGNWFEYKSTRSAQQKVNFQTPFTIDEKNTSINATLVVSPYSWFYKNGLVLDPLNNKNANDIDKLIKESFRRAFKDNNKDGEPD